MITVSHKYKHKFTQDNMLFKISTRKNLYIIILFIKFILEIC